MTQHTFVLVHGAWHGGWCWRAVHDLLVAAGHRVYTPTLTGLGERSHLISREVTLATHITDIVNVFKSEDIHHAILCGHSYGGWVVSGALEEIDQQVASVAFLDAYVPTDGQRVVDTSRPDEQPTIKEAWARGDIARPWPQDRPFSSNPATVAWLETKLTPQPLGVYFDAIRLTGARERIERKAYIRATEYPNPKFDEYARQADDAGWRVYRVPYGHDVMIDAPEGLAEIFCEVV